MTLFYWKGGCCKCTLFYSCWFFVSDLQGVSVKEAESTKLGCEDGQISCLVVNLVEVNYA